MPELPPSTKRKRTGCPAFVAGCTRSRRSPSLCSPSAARPWRNRRDRFVHGAIDRASRVWIEARRPRVRYGSRPDYKHIGNMKSLAILVKCTDVSELFAVE
jgi:hypothetical protein